MHGIKGDKSLYTTNIAHDYWSSVTPQHGFFVSQHQSNYEVLARFIFVQTTLSVAYFWGGRFRGFFLGGVGDVGSSILEGILVGLVYAKQRSHTWLFSIFFYT